MLMLIRRLPDGSSGLAQRRQPCLIPCLCSAARSFGAAMGGASRFCWLLTARRTLYHHSVLRLDRLPHVPPTSFRAAIDPQLTSPFSRLQPTRGCFSGVEEKTQRHERKTMTYDETLISTPYYRTPVISWPEWSKLVEYLTACGYTGRRVPPAIGEDDELSLAAKEMPEDFRNVAVACLHFAREWPDLLRSLSKKDIEVVVENGVTFLFNNALDSTVRMKSFIRNQGNDVSPSEQACTVDLMRYLLSHAWNFLKLTRENNAGREELVESSARSLLHELVMISSGSHGTDSTSFSARQAYFGHDESRKRPQQTIELKKGDWFCPKCNFMNFAKNIKCLECSERRPKMQLAGGDWECPQCDFFNYARNMKCLRCDCKRPEEIPTSRRPGLEQILSSGNVDKADIERRLAENDEKAERWFNKISQLDNSSDLSSAIADDDFPEIMPLRKGMNRFVVSSRKTPLERRLANSQVKGNVSEKMSESAISQTLDRILSSSPSTSSSENSLPSQESMPGQTDNRHNDAFQGSSHQLKGDALHSLTPLPYKRRIAIEQASNSNFIPFVPFPPNYFAKKGEGGNSSAGADTHASQRQSQRQSQSQSIPPAESQGRINGNSSHGYGGKTLEGSAVTEPDPLDMSEEAKAQRWFRRVSQIKDISELSSIPDEDFPEIMPLRKGVNRFVVSKRKTPLERRLTSPQYRRNLPITGSSDPDKE